MEERGPSLTFILDCSAFGPVILDDEAATILPGLADALAAGDAVVPSHWQMEVASALLTAIRRGRYPPGREADARATIEALSIEVDEQTGRHLWTTSWALADRHRLTIYDAAYLELALRLKAPLATHDTALARAARAEDVALFGQ